MQYNVNIKSYWLKQRKVSEMLKMEDRYRTCCNCWHIRAGTVMLGLIELVSVSVIFSGIVRQLKWKTIEQTICSKKRWRDCLHVHNFNLTLIGDYVIAIMLISIAICILLLFYGIIMAKSRYLLPHLIVQGIALLFSFGYFILYAWSYFYGDLYIQHKAFVIEYFLERIWLSLIILIFAIFQCYLFITVIKCSLYLNKLNLRKQQRFIKFEEVSNRVRLAKENGLWRSTSWGGGFQQYRGQYDRKKPDEKKHTNNHVQWDLDKNIEKSSSCNKSSTTQFQDQYNFNEMEKKPKLDEKKKKTSQSLTSESLHIQKFENAKTVKRGSSINSTNRRLKESNKKENVLNKEINENIIDKNCFSTNRNVNAIIYTKITPTNQKPIPKALLHLRPSFDYSKKTLKQQVNKKAESLPKSKGFKQT